MTTDTFWQLLNTAEGLILQDSQDKHQKLFIDFNSGEHQYRRLHGGGNGQPIAKAIGIKKYDHPPTVIDATAGMGRDSFVLASLGCHVIAIERHPLLAPLLQDALNRAKPIAELQAIIERMTLITGNAIEQLPALAAQYHPDVIYLDPMFPERQKSALVKQELRILKALAGSDEDAGKLLDIARQCAPKIVVKRPRIAPTLTHEKPSWQLIGERNRFDIYLNAC